MTHVFGVSGGDLRLLTVTPLYSLWWEDKLNSIPLYHLALIKPNFPGASTSD